MTRPDWRSDGEEPDYRFSLANERTFLAWLRTGLAILAGAIVLDQFASSIGPEWLVRLAGSLLCLAAALVFASGYLRWRRNEIAMRHSRPLPRGRAMELLTVIVIVTAVGAGVILLT